MKIIYNNIIPFKGFYAINLFGILFVRGHRTPTDRVMTHETVHTKQMQEMMYIFFYLWYVIEWFIKLFIFGFTHKAYRNISFEQEARYWQDRTEIARKHFGWCKYIFKSKVK